jgi:hypothetical protein
MSLFGSRCETDNAGLCYTFSRRPKTAPAAVSVSPRGERHSVQRRKCAAAPLPELHRASADAECLAVYYARAALVEAQDAPFQLGPAHAPALLICASLAVLLIAAT